MRRSHKWPGDDCLYLGHRPGSSQFLEHAQTLGITLPDTLPLLTLAMRGWLWPRLRIALPPAAISACWNSRCDPTGSADYDPAHAWAHQLLAQCSTSSPPVLPTDAPWKHWLESQLSEPGREVLNHAIDVDPTSCPAPTQHPLAPDLTIVPVIDFYADWQAYHLAELLDLAEFRVFLATADASELATRYREHVQQVAQGADNLTAKWAELGRVFEWITRFRTIWASHAQLLGDDFDQAMRRDTAAWAKKVGVDAAKVRTAIKDTLLDLWADWQERPPLDSHSLRQSLQRDIGLATQLLRNLTGEAIDPFDEDWFWPHEDRSNLASARLIDALPNEEWRAPITFAELASFRTRAFPTPYALSKAQLWNLLRAHWTTCAPLRRFCLAWVRLMRSRLRDAHRHPDATIEANDRIEQFNLVGLHTERVLRHVHARIAKPEPEIKPIVRGAVERAVRVVAKSHQNGAGRSLSDLLEDTKLHQPRAANDLPIDPYKVNTGSPAADAIVVAHLNALVARNYAAHHDYLDEDLVGPSHDDKKPHPGFTLLSSCLLVVVAAIHSLPVKQSGSA
jgi:hypothetical protein